MKNIRVVFSLIIAMVVLVFSTVCFAEPTVITEIVELQCGVDISGVPVFVRDGAPNIQLSVETLGIRESEEEGIIRVEEVEMEGVKRKNRMRMISGSGLPVKIRASCMPFGNTKIIPLSGDFFICDRGRGIELKLLRPNSENPDEFHAVLKLTTVVYDDLLEETTEPEKSETASELAIESETQVVSQLELLNQRWEEVRGFLEGKGYSARAIDVFHLRVNQGRQQELNSELEILERERQMLEIQRIMLRTPTGEPPQPTPVNPSVNLGLNLGFSESG